MVTIATGGNSILGGMASGALSGAMNGGDLQNVAFAAMIGGLGSCTGALGAGADGYGTYAMGAVGAGMAYSQGLAQGLANYGAGMIRGSIARGLPLSMSKSGTTPNVMTMGGDSASLESLTDNGEPVPGYLSKYLLKEFPDQYEGARMDEVTIYRFKFAGAILGRSDGDRIYLREDIDLSTIKGASLGAHELLHHTDQMRMGVTYFGVKYVAATRANIAHAMGSNEAYFRNPFEVKAYEIQAAVQDNLQNNRPDWVRIRGH